MVPSWLRALIKALSKSSYIRHDLNAMTLRIWWLYTIVGDLGPKEKIDWFNNLYENGDDLSDEFYDEVMSAISYHIPNRDHASLVKSRFGLWESGDLPEMASCNPDSTRYQKINPEIVCYSPYKTLGKNLPPLPALP